MQEILHGPFFLIRKALLTHITMGIGRLLDPPEDWRKKRVNLSLERLLETINPHCPQELNDRLARMLGDARTNGEVLKTWRDRHFGHADKEMTLADGIKGLTAVPPETFRKVLDLLRNMLAEIHAHFSGSEAQMPFPARVGDADKLFEYIRAGYESLQEDP
jgi:hypothetical protein